MTLASRLLFGTAAMFPLISLFAATAQAQTAGRLVCVATTEIVGVRAQIDDVSFQTADPIVTFRVTATADEWIYSNVKKERDQDFLSVFQRDDGVLIFSGIRYRTPTRIDIDLNKNEVVWRSVTDDGCETVRFRCRPR